jgi:hypothetical protein
MTIEVRAVIHFFYLLDTPDEDILAQLESAYGGYYQSKNSASLDLETLRRENRPWQ